MGHCSWLITFYILEINVCTNCELVIIWPRVKAAEASRSWGHVTEAGTPHFPVPITACTTCNCRILLSFLACLCHTSQLPFFVASFFYLLCTVAPTKAKGKKVKAVMVLASLIKGAKKAGNKRWVTATTVQDLNVLLDEVAAPPGQHDVAQKLVVMMKMLRESAFAHHGT